MSSIAIVSGSPNRGSRVNAFIAYSRDTLQAAGFEVKTIYVSELPAEDLVRTNFASVEIQEKAKWVEESSAVLLVSPVYKATFTGVLKLFLDMLPQRGLERKIVLPLFVGGSIAHLLAIDYGLKPVVSALGGRHVLGGVYGVDSWIERVGDGFAMNEEVTARLDAALQELILETRRRDAYPEAAEQTAASVERA